MIQYELNDAYKKISNSIESQFHDEIYSKITNRIINLKEPINKKTDECINYFGISEDFRIRQRDIEEKLDDASYQFRKSMADRKEEIEELFQSFYIGLKNVVSKDISKEDKTKFLARYVDDLTYKVSSLHNNAKNSVEFFDDLDNYFKARSGNDDFYYEMKTFLNAEKEKFINKYLGEINRILKSSLKKAQDDIDNYVLPHINKEERKKEEKEQEQANNGAVTKKLSDGSITSPYLSVDISNFKSNKELNNTIASLIHYIMYMDLYRSQNSANNLRKKFAESISVCRTSEDFNKLDELLKKLSDMGGYASKFYLAVSPSIKEKEASCLERETKESVEIPEVVKQETEFEEKPVKESEELDKKLLFSVEPGALETRPKTVKEGLTDLMHREVVEEQKEEQPMNNTKKSVYYEISDQFTKGIETIINQKIHFLERHNLSLKLHDISFMQAREIEEASTKMLNAIAEMYQMRKETREEDSNLLLDNFVAYVENCMKKDYASNVFEDVSKKIMNNNDLWLTFEQMEQLNNLAEESKNNFNLYMRNEIMSMQKETLEKANKHFGIVSPTSNDEILEENKGHKI